MSFMINSDMTKRWLQCSKESRDAVLKELQDIARDWADPNDPSSQEDSVTLMVAFELLSRIKT